MLARLFNDTSDRLVAGGCIRPDVLLKGFRYGTVAPQRLSVLLIIAVSGLVLEPTAWLQSLCFGRQLKRCRHPDNPIIVIGHWRSGTTYLHQLLAADKQAATARNSLTIAPQAALLLKPLLRPLLKRLMTTTRPIDAVCWGADDPQEDELGLARLSIDTNMAGVAFPRDYSMHFRRCVLATTSEFERLLLQFTRLTWLDDGAGKTHLLIKNPAHMARIPLLLRLFPRARFVLLQRQPIDTIRSLVQVKQRLAELIGLQPALSACVQVEETFAAHEELLQAFKASRALIPAGQLVEVSYDDLIHSPLHNVERIYTRLGLKNWQQARASIAERIQRGSGYRAAPVQLEPEAEQRLRELLGSPSIALIDQTQPGRKH